LVTAGGRHIFRLLPAVAHSPPECRSIRVRFDRGTLLLTDLAPGEQDRLPGVVWDPRARSLRAAAYRFAALATCADGAGVHLEGDLRAGWPPAPGEVRRLELRPYQSQALAAWNAFGRRGVVSLATGGGKTRIAIGALLTTGVPAVVLCPTRALAAQWLAELGRWFNEPIGMVGDGRRQVERLTVVTFESAYRHMDDLGDRFGLLVVDEVHHFGSGARVEALESCAATARLGLTATAPDPGSDAATRIGELVGPIVFEMGIGELAGTHLAPLDIVSMPVTLTEDERSAYSRLTRAFSEHARTFFRAHHDGAFVELTRTLARSAEGRRALIDNAAGQALASFPSAKRRLVGELLRDHRADKTIVFTALAENAYDIASESLIPVIAAETSSRERADILRRFRDGPIRAIATARVLNEGIDVPDARVAIVVAGVLGRREHVQRIGRVLRPVPGKRALLYELVTMGTNDARRAARRRSPAMNHAPGSPS
jgi:superfamily II DNA or RNA helicase